MKVSAVAAAMEKGRVELNHSPRTMAVIKADVMPVDTQTPSFVLRFGLPPNLPWAQVMKVDSGMCS